MADDMEKKGQQGQSGQGQHGGQSGQPGQGQHGGQSGQGQHGGQSGQQQPKKGGQSQYDNTNEEDDQNRDRQRKAS